VRREATRLPRIAELYPLQPGVGNRFSGVEKGGISDFVETEGFELRS